MSPLAIVLMVVGILVGVAAVNLAVWLPILRKLRRLPELMREELAGEKIAVGPERAVYRGATSTYGRVKGLGVAALTERRLAFRKAIGKPVDVPVDQIVGVREDRVFLRSVTAGRRHVIVKLSDGTEVGYYFASPEQWLGALRLVAEERAAR
jgi:hypothetical protein